MTVHHACRLHGSPLAGPALLCRAMLDKHFPRLMLWVLTASIRILTYHRAIDHVCLIRCWTRLASTSQPAWRQHPRADCKLARARQLPQVVQLKTMTLQPGCQPYDEVLMWPRLQQLLPYHVLTAHSWIAAFLQFAHLECEACHQ